MTIYIVFYNGIKVKSYNTLKAARAGTVRKINYLRKHHPEHVIAEFSIFDSLHKRHNVTA